MNCPSCQNKGCVACLPTGPWPIVKRASQFIVAAVAVASILVFDPMAPIWWASVIGLTFWASWQYFRLVKAGKGIDHPKSVPAGAMLAGSGAAAPGRWAGN